MTIGLAFIIVTMLIAVGSFVYAAVLEHSEAAVGIGILFIIISALSIGTRSDTINREKMIELCVKEGKNVTQIFDKKVCVLE